MYILQTALEIGNRFDVVGNKNMTGKYPGLFIADY
jgi:hypothetical protein